MQLTQQDIEYVDSQRQAAAQAAWEAALASRKKAENPE